MIAAWMLYSVLVSALAGGAALAVEAVLRSHRKPARGIWVAAGTLSVLWSLRLLVPESWRYPWSLAGAQEVDALAPPSAWALALDPVTVPIGSDSLLQRLDAPLLVLWSVASALLLAAESANEALHGCPWVDRSPHHVPVRAPLPLERILDPAPRLTTGVEQNVPDLPPEEHSRADPFRHSLMRRLRSAASLGHVTLHRCCLRPGVSRGVPSASDERATGSPSRGLQSCPALWRSRPGRDPRPP